MGEMYHEGEYDLAGFAVGAVEKDDYIDGSNVQPGQVIIGLASSGIHSNGYSLVRQLIAKANVQMTDKFTADESYLETLLKPTRLYVNPVLEVIKKYTVHAMTHITGGGFYENIPRALPEGVTANIDVTTFPTPKIFDWLQEQGEISTEEMYNIFNMGIGFTLVVDAANSKAIIEHIKRHNIEAFEIGTITSGDEPIQLTGVKA